LIAKAPAAERQKLQALRGKAAIANAKQAYAAYREIFGGPRFTTLRDAQPQRVLWASTGTKDPAYPDTLYVDELIGPDTVNTLPPATLAAFQDHGKPSRTVDRDLPAANQVIVDLASVGISVPEECERQLAAGVASFAGSLDNLFQLLGERRSALVASSGASAPASK
jgi:transaldolase/glucose-6-phosphate isomerase